jgi:hypothetical protein
MRCSALPLATKCRGSYKLTGGHGSEQSRVGTAFHEAARAKVRNLPIDKESLRTRYGLTEDELKSIDYGIYNLQIKIPEGAMVLADDKQFTMINGKLTGTPDLGIYYNRIVTVVDWKSGFGDVEDPETNNQAMGYGIGMLEELERQGQPVDRVDLMIVQPKLNQVKAFSFTPEKIRSRMADIERIIDEAECGEGQFTTGPWCSACFKNMNCPAFAGQVKTLAEFVEPGEILDIEKALRILLPVSKACATVSRKIDALAKAWVDKNGPLVLGGGQSYVKVIEEKKEVDAKKAFETLKEYFGEDEVWGVMSASMTKVTELAVKTKRGLSTVVKNRMTETGALTAKMAETYRIIKGGSNGGTTENGNSNKGTE